MAELVWSLNGKYFKDFGIYISSSDGLFDELKQKKEQAADWPEYNGLAIDLSAKPRFESREIVLSGWVEGADWQKMRENFISIFGEFRKAGKQRITLEVFGEKTLVYDLRCEDKIALEKKFRKGKMIGFFQVKLIEQNPVKKILYTDKSNIQLSFSSPKWVDINIDGVIETRKGSVSIDRTLTNRVITKMSFPGRNLAKNSKGLIDKNTNWVRDFFLSENLIVGQQYSVSVTVNAVTQNANAYFEIGDDSGRIKSLTKVTPTRFEASFTATRTSSKIILFREPNDNSYYQFLSLKLEKGIVPGDWTPAPEDQHFISIAGNIDEISNLTTNAEVLWERL